jgi:Tfp pilus assembly protein PilW
MTPAFRKSFRALVRHDSRGVTLVELMISITISMLVLLALVSLYVNLARANDEMAKTNSLIENGRFALQVMENDLVHAGYWGGYLPQFDDLTAATAPGDIPTLLPNPCTPYASWDSFYKTSLIGIPVQASDVLWPGSGCTSPAVQRPGTDALVVRHLDMCVPGDVNCDALTAGRLYFQNSFCSAEKNAGTASGASSNTLVLGSGASSTNSAYVGVMIHTAGGTGAGQYRWINAYNGSTKTATLSTAWTVIPDNSTTYALEYVLGTSAYPLHKHDCVGTGAPATLPVTAGTIAERRRFVSNLYYIANAAHPDNAGEVVPTLMRSQLDVAAGVLSQRPPVALIDGIEAFRVEFGVDDVSETGDAVDFTQPIDWDDPTTMTTPTNRGDGAPDRFIHCTTAGPCAVSDLMNAVLVKVWVLARSRDTSRGYTDGKAYCLGSLDPDDGSCPQLIAAANDQYKRHVFSTSVRLVNVSGRRETPFP